MIRPGWWLTAVVLILCGRISRAPAGEETTFSQSQVRRAQAGVLVQRLEDLAGGLRGLQEKEDFFLAEFLRRQGLYYQAADAYVGHLKRFPGGRHSATAVQHLFDIANYWLEDTREEMLQRREEREGKRLFVWPQVLHFDVSKPLFLEEKHAVELLELVVDAEPAGPLAAKALFLMGAVAFFREDYAAADRDFSRIFESLPQSPLSQQALELALISKSSSLDSCPDRSAKKVEIRTLVSKIRRDDPRFAREKEDLLDRTLQKLEQPPSPADPFDGWFDALLETVGGTVEVTVQLPLMCSSLVVDCAFGETVSR